MSKRICLPIDREVYERIVDDPQLFRSYVDACRQKYPELFPPTFEQGYKCMGYCEPSKKKPEVKVRRLRTKAVNGKDESYWYRLTQSLALPRSNFSLVGTTAKGAEQPLWMSPPTRSILGIAKDWNGEDAYIATTVGNGCFWGASISLGADESSLTQAYGVFKNEAQALDQDYEPKTVNTDGFKSTRNAWTTLFAQSVLILCFLHGFIRIRDGAKRLTIFPELATRVWEVYRQESYEHFIDKITVLKLWTEYSRKSLILGAPRTVSRP